MKQRRVLIITLLALLLTIGIPTGFLMREFQREQASRDLITAIKADDIPSALSTLKHGALPNTRDGLDNSPLSFREQMRHLLDKIFQPNVKTPQSNHRPTALLLSLETNKQANPLLIKALLNAGASPDLTGEKDEITPIMKAVVGNSPQILQLLLQQGGNPRLLDREGWTALHYAAICNNVEDIVQLIDAGADIEAEDKDGLTPLMRAYREDKPEALQVLLEHHANPNPLDASGNTPLDQALEAEEAEPHSKERIIALLRKAGAKTG